MKADFKPRRQRSVVEEIVVWVLVVAPIVAIAAALRATYGL